jgi:hypothetical protein
MYAGLCTREPRGDSPDIHQPNESHAQAAIMPVSHVTITGGLRFSKGPEYWISGSFAMALP